MNYMFIKDQKNMDINKELEDIFMEFDRPEPRKRQIGLEFTMRCFNQRMKELFVHNKKDYRLV